MGQDGVTTEPRTSSVNVSQQQGTALVLRVKSSILPEELSIYSNNDIPLYVQLLLFFFFFFFKVWF